MKHCWHYKGHSTIDGLGNSKDAIICCNCGKSAIRYKEIETYKIEGHGPYAPPEKRQTLKIIDEDDCKIK